MNHENGKKLRRVYLYMSIKTANTSPNIFRELAQNIYNSFRDSEFRMSGSAVNSCGSPKEDLAVPASDHEPSPSTQKQSDNCGFPKDKLPEPKSGHEAVYPLDDPKLENELRFFQNSTRIQDPSLLKSHFMKIRDMAYECFPYPCIWVEFLKGKSIVHPFYPQIQKKQPMQADQQIIMIDFGCFMGIDLRQVVNDGWKLDNILGVDLHEEWHNLGLQLFNDADRAPPFFKGDIFNPNVFDPSAPSHSPNDSVLDLRALKDLNQVKGRANFISAHQLFHLFSENDQRELAKRLALLLSDEPGSGLFGTHLGLPEENFEPYALYLHSPKSWKKLSKEILGEDNCKVNAELEEFDTNHRYRSFPGVNRAYWLHWSVVRT